MTKIRKLAEVTQPIKAVASMLFAGLVCMYMVSGVLYSFFTGAEISYSIPFIFIIQGMGLTVVIAILRELIFSDFLIKKWRFFHRMAVFSVLLIALLTLGALTFLAIPAEFTFLWLISACVIALGATVIFGISEVYYRRTGEWYNEMLRVYKEEHGKVSS